MSSMPTGIGSARLEELLAQHVSDHEPGVALGVLVNGERSFAFRGLANIEQRLPVSADTLFEIGSLTKQFAAAALLLLDREGVLDLESDARSLIPELHRPHPPIRLRHFLEHTSGVRDYFGLAALAELPPGADNDRATMLDLLFRQQSLNFPPGSDRAYSNSGYLLAALAAERASSPLAGAIGRLFALTGMDRSRVSDNPSDVIAHRATGYALQGDQWMVDDAQSDIIGDRGIASSVSDLLSWADAVARDDHELRSVLAAAESPIHLADGTSIPFGLGLEIHQHGDLEYFRHPGGIGGFRADLVRAPATGFAVACVTNNSRVLPWSLCNEVLRACFGDPPAVASPAAETVAVDPPDLAGSYLSPSGLQLCTVSDPPLSMTIGGTALVLESSEGDWYSTTTAPLISGRQVRDPRSGRYPRHDRHVGPWSMAQDQASPARRGTRDGTVCGHLRKPGARFVRRNLDQQRDPLSPARKLTPDWLCSHRLRHLRLRWDEAAIRQRTNNLNHDADPRLPDSRPPVHQARRACLGMLRHSARGASE